MYLRTLAAFLGIAVGAGLGVALATGPAAVADAIDDAWPYGVPVGPGAVPSEGTTLPGFPDTGSLTSQGDFNYLHGVGGAPWYSVHDSTFAIPDLFGSDQQTVTDVLDTSAAYPTVGTVASSYDLFPSSNPALDGFSLIQSYSLDDPDLGSASAFALPGMANTFISDAAGVKDIISFFGQTSTLFEIPFSTAGSTSASDLLAEFANAFPGVDTLLGLS